VEFALPRPITAPMVSSRSSARRLHSTAPAPRVRPRQPHALQLHTQAPGRRLLFAGAAKEDGPAGWRHQARRHHKCRYPLHRARLLAVALAPARPPAARTAWWPRPSASRQGLGTLVESLASPAARLVAALPCGHGRAALRSRSRPALASPGAAAPLVVRARPAPPDRWLFFLVEPAP